jgi:ABC-2 type transport system ATP-binding protein
VGGAARDGGRARLGLTARARDPVTQLSLGNQQRVQLAAALAHQPQLLLLDEPFSGLDPVATDVMAELLREQAAAGVSVLFSSHQLELVERLCDQVTIIADGRVVANGTIAELRALRTDRQLRIELPDGHPDWMAQPGVRDVAHDGQAVVLTVEDDLDEQTLLDLARRTGRVTHFGRVVPSLADLYRGVAS